MSKGDTQSSVLITLQVRFQVSAKPPAKTKSGLIEDEIPTTSPLEKGRTAFPLVTEHILKKLWDM